MQSSFTVAMMAVAMVIIAPPFAVLAASNSTSSGDFACDAKHPDLGEGNDNCCSFASQCNLGGGDCDEDSHCAGPLVCGDDNCAWGDGDDCCQTEEESDESYNYDYEIAYYGSSYDTSNPAPIDESLPKGAGKLIDEAHRTTTIVALIRDFRAYYFEGGHPDFMVGHFARTCIALQVCVAPIFQTEVVLPFY